MKAQCVREIFFRMKQQGHSMKTIAAALGVTRQTLHRWQKEGLQKPARSSGRPQARKVNNTVAAALFQHFSNQNTVTLRQAADWLAQHHAIHVCRMTVLNYCRRYRLTYKKATKAYLEMNEMKARQFLRQMATSYSPRVVALDEAAFCLNHVRAYAWSIRGSRAIVARPAVRKKARSLLLCVSSTGVIKWELYEGAVDAVRFSTFLQDLPDGSNVVLDNAKIHHATKSLTSKGMKTVAQTASDKNLTMSYLPAYAPKLNPTELCFNMIRTYVNREAPRNHEDLYSTIQAAIASITPTVCDRTMKKVFEID